MDKNRRKIIISWCLYDWANSAFATTVMAAVLPVYYSSVAAADLSRTQASSYWGYTNTAAMLIVALLAPVFGAMADHGGRKKVFLAAFAMLGIFSSAALYRVEAGEWRWASMFYVLGMIGFSVGNNFYDSLLPHISSIESIDRISTYGYAMGYLGGGLLLALNLGMIMNPGLVGLPNAEEAARGSFLTVALWWAIFAVPLFRYVPEPPVRKIPGESPNPFRASFQRLYLTLSNLRQHREAFKFLIAFWLYNDGIGTIISMAVIFGAEIQIAQEHLIGAILLVQFIGIPCSLFFGYLSGIIGTRTAILFGLGVYTGIAVGGYFLRTALHFWILAILVGLVQGGTQALSRSLFGSLIPRERSAEFFSFYDVSSKIAGILGPFVFGLVGQITGSSRFSIVALVLFFLSGGAVLLRVKLPEKEMALRSN
jgi:UMF1 family MFS transporter